MSQFFLAKNDKQLGICLRLLLAEGINGIMIEQSINERNKVEFHISAGMDGQTFDMLSKKYRILIS